MLRCLMLPLLALAVSGCASSLPPVVRTEIVRRALPDEARKPCDAPVTPPGRTLSQAEVATFWGHDRAALRTCEQRRAAAVGAQ